MYCLTIKSGDIRWVGADYQPELTEKLIGTVVLYYNNGLSLERIARPYVLQKGEKFFPDFATSDQLTAAFPNYSTSISNVTAQQKITDLESSISLRRLREAILGTDGGWLKSIDAQIAVLRKSIM